MPKGDVDVRVIDRQDVTEASRICRVAFGTFMGAPDPERTFGDAEFLANRWMASPNQVLGAYVDGRIVGSNFVGKWGSFGLFGPLTVLPELWGKGIASHIMESTMEMFSKWETTNQGLFTFPDSPKHLGLYGKYGFKAKSLTPVMRKVISPSTAPSSEGFAYTKFSELNTVKGRNRVFSELQELCGGILPGLDLESEIQAVYSLKLGETILLNDDSRIVGFGICHHGPNTEAGTGNCYVKFGAVQQGTSAGGKLGRLLESVEAFASHRGLATVDAGVNTARVGAHEVMTGHGYHAGFTGVAMERPDEPALNRSDVFAVDDWR